MDPKYEELRAVLENFGKVAVAFSGGVDSTLLLKVARMTLGDDVLAVYGSSALQKKGSLQRARSIADEVGTELFIKDYDPLSWPEFRDNPEARCYYCKRRIYSGFLEAIPSGYTLVDASQLDDLAQERPGMQAIRELGVKTPLIDASFHKKEVRRLAKNMSLSNWLSPSESCLATRIKSGRPVTREELELIARGEEFLEGLGFSGCRVRYDEAGVFISLVDSDYSKMGNTDLRREIEKFFLSLAGRQVFLTLSGRPGIKA